MPAPKQFKPGPSLVDKHASARATATKGRYAVVKAATPVVEDSAVVEVAIDDLTLVVGGSSKYEQRSFHAYGDVEEAEVVEEETLEVIPDPVIDTTIHLGEWRTESSLDGSRYRRKDSRLI